jgi:hypothetical protein
MVRRRVSSRSLTAERGLADTENADVVQASLAAVARRGQALSEQRPEQVLAVDRRLAFGRPAVAEADARAVRRALAVANLTRKAPARAATSDRLPGDAQERRAVARACACAIAGAGRVAHLVRDASSRTCARDGLSRHSKDRGAGLGLHAFARTIAGAIAVADLVGGAPARPHACDRPARNACRGSRTVGAGTGRGIVVGRCVRGSASYSVRGSACVRVASGRDLGSTACCGQQTGDDDEMRPHRAEIIRHPS